MRLGFGFGPLVCATRRALLALLIAEAGTELLLENGSALIGESLS